MSETRTPSRERLAALAEIYGADPARWPEAERDAALRLIETDPGARALLAPAAALDALLDAAPAPHPSAALAGRLLAAAPQPRGARLRLFLGGLMRPATGLAVAAILGIVVGTLAPMEIDDGAEATAEREITTLLADGSLDLDAPPARRPAGPDTDGSR